MGGLRAGALRAVALRAGAEGGKQEGRADRCPCEADAQLWATAGRGRDTQGGGLKGEGTPPP
eukprot:364964-Chlamydomonas_euryale.AAC.4